MILIRPMTADDAAVFRETRLRALIDAPLAFGSNYATESANTDQQWQQRVERWNSGGSRVCLAFDDGSQSNCCGIVASFEDEQVPGRFWIVSMWVAPEARRQGLGRRLIESIEAWARQEHAAELRLHATETNHPAIELYRRCGFEMTGESEPYPNDPRLRELVMAKRLFDR